MDGKRDERAGPVLITDVGILYCWKWIESHLFSHSLVCFESVSCKSYNNDVYVFVCIGVFI